MLNWQPSASIEDLKQRATLLSQIRDFFNQRGYLEVDTPQMSRYGVSDLYLRNIEAQFRGQRYYLQTSPEYAMKRLLAAGSGPIFQLARVFRDDELGRWHNPEFTLLEWYQLNVCHHQLMDEVDALLQQILRVAPMQRMTYQQAFLDSCNVDPLTASTQQLRAVLSEHDLQNVLPPDEQDIDQYLFLLMSHVVEPYLGQLDRPAAVYHFPPSQAALAKINQGLAERFEVYYRGVELANGFHELTDASMQRQRFEQDNQLRRAHQVPEMAADEHLLAAMQHGLPPCSGVALGIDRLVALALDKARLADIMAFDFSRV